jgi:hypothetical protein
LKISTSGHGYQVFLPAIDNENKKNKVHGTTTEGKEKEKFLSIKKYGTVLPRKENK